MSSPCKASPATMPDNQASATTPLLSRPAVARQHDGPLFKNLYIDVALLAQAGILALVLIIWVHVLSHDLILFSGHPLFQSLAVLVLTQSLLLLQPTSARDPDQKRAGQRAHAVLNLAAFLLLVVGVSIIEVNKFRSNGPHFHSVHGYFGVIVSIIILVQYLVGFTMWAVPALYGGEGNARALYKYHRVSGYVVYVGLMATILSAVWTDYNKNVLGLDWWMLALPIVVILTLLLRINLSKLGLRAEKQQTPATTATETGSG